MNDLNPILLLLKVDQSRLSMEYQSEILPPTLFFCSIQFLVTLSLVMVFWHTRLRQFESFWKGSGTGLARRPNHTGRLGVPSKNKFSAVASCLTSGNQLGGQGLQLNHGLFHFSIWRVRQSLFPMIFPPWPCNSSTSPRSSFTECVLITSNYSLQVIRRAPAAAVSGIILQLNLPCPTSLLSTRGDSLWHLLTIAGWIPH